MFNFLNPDDNPEAITLANSIERFAKENLIGVHEYRKDDFSQMASLGLTAIGVRESCSGISLESISSASVLFEIAKYNLGPAVYLSVHQMVSRLINSFADNDYQLATLSSLASGKKLGAFCLTEAGAGSDASALSLKASKTKTGFTLSGEKIYISSAPHADVFLVFARTGGAGSGGVSCFVVDAQTKGIEVGPIEKKMGCEASPIASVRFSDCEIGNECLLGTENEGFSIAMSGLDRGRVSIAACACGLSASALSKSREHLRERKQFNKALREFQGLQFIYADMLMQHRAAVLLTRDAAKNLDSSTSENTAASMAKCFATDAAMKITTDAVQLLGGAGYLVEYGVEQLMRDAKMLQIVEGTNQIQRVIIARSLKP